MQLGAILRHLESDVTAGALLQATGDVMLVAQVRAAGESHGETAGQYASIAASRFANLASDEDWLALMTCMERAGEPAAACLGHMLQWALKEEAKPAPASSCSCGGHGGGVDSCVTG